MKLFQVLALMACTLTVQADSYFSGGGAAIGTNLTYFATPAENGLTVIDYIAASVDGSASIRFYQARSPVGVDASSVTGTNRITVNQSTPLASNSVIVVRSKRYGTSQRLVVTNATAFTIQASTTLATNLMDGDSVFPMFLVATLPLTNFTTFGSGTPIFSARDNNSPVMIEIVGTNQPSLHIVTGRAL